MPVVLPEAQISVDTQELFWKLGPSGAGELQAQALLLCSISYAGIQGPLTQQ